MTKCIKIDNCNECPNQDPKGTIGKVAYIPRCREAAKELPYTAQRSSIGGEIILTACCPGEIPSWCPLEDYNE